MNLLTILLAAIIMNTSLKQNQENILLNSSIMQTEKQWRIVNDGVMGGLSSSKVFVNDDNKIIFRGNVSLENNGGFASLRSPVKDYNFENFSGIEIKIKGDGKRYSVSMKETTYFNGYFYTSSFETKKMNGLLFKFQSMSLNFTTSEKKPTQTKNFRSTISKKYLC